jgi:hypothetical protein
VTVLTISITTDSSADYGLGGGDEPQVAHDDFIALTSARPAGKLDATDNTSLALSLN